MTSEHILALTRLVDAIKSPLGVYWQAVGRASWTATGSADNEAAIVRGNAALMDIDRAVRTWVAKHPAEKPAPAAPADGDLLDAIAARAAAATPGPWAPYPAYGPNFWANATGLQLRGIGDLNFGDGEEAAADEEFVRHAREDVDTLLAEVRRLRDELAEQKAAQDPRLRCLLIKADKDQDLYVGWSTICDAPAGVWSRETAAEYGFPVSRLDRADATGTSSTGRDGRPGLGGWEDTGFIAEQRGFLRRDLVGKYAVEYLHGDREAAYALLDPFEREDGE